MKISLCIPQYNRIDYLLKNLNIIAMQTYPDIEVVISDDCSTDNTEKEIKKISSDYKYPLVYSRNTENYGYDRNLRKSMELASGDYCFILGNDDTLHDSDDISFLVDFLKKNNYPEVGFCNFVEDHDKSKIIERASFTKVIGEGYDIALKYYRSFSFVAGVIYKNSSFKKANTDRFDKSIYVQLYLAALIIARGGRLFMIKEPLVIKDLVIGSKMANSYRDVLIRKWKDLKPLDGGLPSAARVVIAAFDEAGLNSKKSAYNVLKGIYQYTFPYWLLDYRKNNAFVSSVGMVAGLYPSNIKELRLISPMHKISIYFTYFISSMIGLLTPVIVFNALKLQLYKIIKK